MQVSERELIEVITQVGSFKPIIDGLPEKFNLISRALDNGLREIKDECAKKVELENLRTNLDLTRREVGDVRQNLTLVVAEMKADRKLMEAQEQAEQELLTVKDDVQKNRYESIKNILMLLAAAAIGGGGLKALETLLT